MIRNRLLLSSIVAVGLVMSAADQATAQSYPTRPITIVIPFPPGGTVDIVARFLAERLPSSLRQPVIVEHRPGGAGGTVGAKAVASAEPDGHTLLLSSPGPLVVAPAVYKNLGYDPAKSFTPIATAFTIPQMLVVNPALPVKSIRDLVAHAKANPGRISYASPGYATQPHLLGEMFRMMTGVSIVHVPYRGPAPAVTDLLAGQVQMYFETVGLVRPHVEAGKLKALAVADKTRHPQLADVPTTIESGFPQLQAAFWSGILAPAGTSARVVDKLNAAINDSLKSPELQASLAAIGARPMVGSPQDIAAFMAAETRKWSDVVSAAGIKAE